MRESLIKALPFWKLLTGEEKKIIEQRCVEQSYKKGEVIYSSLKDSHGIKIVTAGQIRVCIPVPKGELLLNRFGSGKYCILGVFPCLRELPWDVSVEAEANTDILSIPEKVYNEISEHNSSLMEFNQQIIVGRISEMIHILSQIAVANTEQRLALLLLRMAEETKVCEIKLTHETMAKDICTAREVVSRQLKQFEACGLVRIGRGKVSILNLEGLKAVYNE